jgi:hypothetical protein
MAEALRDALNALEKGYARAAKSSVDALAEYDARPSGNSPACVCWKCGVDMTVKDCSCPARPDSQEVCQHDPLWTPDAMVCAKCGVDLDVAAPSDASVSLGEAGIAPSTLGVTAFPWDIQEGKTLLHIETANMGDGKPCGMPVCSIPKSRLRDAEFIVAACNAAATPSPQREDDGSFAIRNLYKPPAASARTEEGRAVAWRFVGDGLRVTWWNGQPSEEDRKAAKEKGWTIQCAVNPAPTTEGGK